MTGLVALSLVLALPPDHSKAYFSKLDRPAAQRVQIERGGGPVILIVIDALRPDRLTAYGSERDTSPNLARLADEGLVLTNYFVNGNWTRPSTASILTGLPPAAHGVERERDKLAEEFTTLAQLLSQTGVPTGAVVGNGNAGSAFGLARGFDFYADTVKHWRGLPSAEQVVELAVPFVREHRDKPFFLMLFFVDPHDPYHAPGEFEQMFVGDPKVRLVRTPHWEVGNYTPAEIERMRATYDGAVRYTDSVLGRFFDTLRDLGIWDQSTIIVTADHGEAFGEHGVYLHSHHFFDEIVRAPLIIRAPVMSTRGAYNHYLFQTIDLLPTLANYYGAKVARSLPGIDIVDHLAKPATNDANRIVISEFNNFGIRRRMIRTYTEKVIYEEPADAQEFMATVGDKALLPSVQFDKERVQMFDVAKDPLETRDVYSAKTAARPKWKRLLDQIRAYRSQRPARPAASLVENLDKETREDLKTLGYIQ
jgi:arylsulfatase A-like enzyme